MRWEFQLTDPDLNNRENDRMTQKIPAKIKFTSFFLFIVITSFGLAVYGASIPGDEKDSVFLGFSVARLGLIGLLVFFGAAALFIVWKSNRDDHYAHRLSSFIQRPVMAQWLLWVSGLGVILGWLGFFMPPYWFEDYHAYFVRLRPLLYWVGLVGLQTFLFTTIPGASKRTRDLLQSLRSQPTLVYSMVASLVGLFSIWLLIALTGIGVKSDPYFWNEAGVPILGVQLLLSLAVVMVINRLFFSKVDESKGWVDILSGVGLFGITFLLWSQVPVMRSFFSPGPYMPGNVFHPFSDAAYYDISAQYLLIGQGIANGEYMDKPFYVLLLAIFRYLSGQDYDRTILLQVGVLALTPVGGYLLGKALVNRQTGLLLGLLMTIHQLNALNATPFINVSHSKMMMTEYPTAMLIVFASLAGFLWLRRSQNWLIKAILTGGFLGLAGLMRPNAYIILPFILLLAFFAYRSQARIWAVGALACTLTFLAVVSPWFFEIPRGFTEPYLIAKIRAVIDTRYYDTRIPYAPDLPLESQTQRSLPGLLKPVIPAAIGNFNWQTENGLEEIRSIPFIPNHYFHNHVMAFFILPHTAELKNLEETLQTPYWEDVLRWEGELPADTILMIGLNLVILSIGVGTTWRRWRYAGLTPLVVILSYFLANAIARTSGARYLVAVDWVLLIYFSIGVLQALAWLGIVFGIRPQNRSMDEPLDLTDIQVKPHWTKFVLAAGCILVFLGVGAALPLSKYAFPAQFSYLPTHQLLIKLQEDGRIKFSPEELRNFMNSPNPLVIRGLGLHPRHYPAGIGEPIDHFPDPAISQLRARPYTRLTMAVLAPEGHYTVILPINEVPTDFPSGVDVVAVGCWNGPGNYLDTLAVFTQTDPPISLWREGHRSLVCPLPEPTP